MFTSVLSKVFPRDYRPHSLLGLSDGRHNNDTTYRRDRRVEKNAKLLGNQTQKLPGHKNWLIPSRRLRGGLQRSLEPFNYQISSTGGHDRLKWLPKISSKFMRAPRNSSGFNDLVSRDLQTPQIILAVHLIPSKVKFC